MMTKNIFILFTLTWFLIGCFSAPVRYPLRNMNIPPLEDGESRVFFSRGLGDQYFNFAYVSVAGKHIVALNTTNDCTYIDLTPGEYTFIAVNKGLIAKNIQYTLILEEGDTNHLQWVYKGGLFSRHSSHLMHLSPEQGERVLQICFYVEIIDPRD